MDNLVPVARYLDMSLANIVRGRLEAEGIPAVVVDELAALGNEGGVIAAQGVRVLVPASQAEEATRLLHRVEAEANDGPPES